ncbi:MAG: winged helix-turn-helix domain-containing protein [Acidobacteria bacterium]|nr:winged helix-turn-helix domain-containing protein [Acidobacteriota bacterium]
MRVRWDDLELDGEGRQLLRGGAPLPVTPKAFLLLALLVKRRPRAVSKEEIREAVWPRTFVSESNLSSLVAEVRNLLGDDARNPRAIRTVYGFGYAFCAAVLEDAPQEAPVAPPGRAELLGPTGRTPLREGTNLLGRGEGAVVRLDGETGSRRHAVLRLEGEVATLEDLGSKNGTFLNGTRVDGRTPLADGDEIEAGGRRFTFRRGAPSDSTRTDLRP